jgi:hypothetical protein
MTTTALELLKTGFFLGIGWWTAKAIFVITISKYLGKPIEISTGDN